MNMVPNDMVAYRRQLDCIDNKQFDFFQPLENLRCQSLVNFFLKDPDTIKKEIDKINEGFDASLSLVEIVVLGNVEARAGLVKENWIRSFGEPCFDFHYQNILDQAFDNEDAVTALQILVEHILSLKTSTSL